MNVSPDTEQDFANALPPWEARGQFVWHAERRAKFLGPLFVRLPFATLRIGNIGVLLVADSHGGKSTLIAQALQNGVLPDVARAQLVDDNSTWFDPFSHAICVGRPLMLRRGTQEMMAGRLPPFDTLFAYPHDPDATIGYPVARAPLLSRHRIDTVAILQRRTGPNTLTTLNLAEADALVADILRKRLGRTPSAREVKLLHRIVHQASGGITRLSFDRPEEGVALLAQLHANVSP